LCRSGRFFGNLVKKKDLVLKFYENCKKQETLQLAEKKTTQVDGSDTAVVDRDLGFKAAGQEGLAGGGHVGPTRW
jgi:hypothetical protein